MEIGRNALGISKRIRRSYTEDSKKISFQVNPRPRYGRVEKKGMIFLFLSLKTWFSKNESNKFLYFSMDTSTEHFMLSIVKFFDLILSMQGFPQHFFAVTQFFLLIDKEIFYLQFLNFAE